MRAGKHVAIATALLCGAAGCTFVVGVGDYAVGDAGNAGHPAGDGGADAARDGHATSKGDATSNGDASSSGDATPRRDATTDGGADAPSGADATLPNGCGNGDAGPVLDLCSAAGTVTVLATSPSTYPVVALVADETSVFWSDGVSIWSCPADGCASGMTTVLPGSGAKFITAIAIDSANVYVAGSPSLSSTTNVSACPRSGCAITAVSNYGNATTQATGIASDGVNVFWTDSNGVSTCAIAGGGCPDGSVSVASGVAAPGPLALGSRFAYWVDVSQDQVVRAAKGDTSDATPPGTHVSASFAPLAAGSSQLLVTGNGVYWASPFALESCSTAALSTAGACVNGAARIGPVFAAPATSCGHPNETNTPIATDGTNVYYLAPGAACSGSVGLVRCTPGGDCQVLISKLGHPAGVLAANTKSVFWIDTTGANPVVELIAHP